MRNAARGDVLKVWLYAAAAVALGAWISPWIYNGGKALAEVAAHKTINGPLDGLAGVCRSAEFPRFFEAGLLLAAAVLFFPWLEWLRGHRGEAPDGAGNPWLLRNNPRDWWHGGAGFLLGSGVLLLATGLALAPAGWAMLRHHGDGLAGLSLTVLIRALSLAVVMEVFFRGLVLGIFLRAMRPAAAIGLNAVFFALVLAVIPPPGLNVADPEAAGTGFELLRLVAGRYADGWNVCGTLAPLLVLGGVLAYTRWRTASLWLPIGLHAGWLFAQALRGMLADLTGVPGAAGPALSGSHLQQCVIPLAGIIVAGVLAHVLTTNHDEGKPGGHS